MNKILRVAIAQINPTVGDLEGNAKKILEYVQKAKKFQSDVVVFPELALCGYPPEDLLLKNSFIDQNLAKIRSIANSVEGIVAVVGFVDRDKKGLYNAAAIISGKTIQAMYHKIRLPNYGVFDEKRYFKEGRNPLVFKIGGIGCGMNICEDIWYADAPAKTEIKDGASVIFVINASPYYAGKIKERKEAARKYKTNLVYVNLVGGQDELVFDGQSFVLDGNGKEILKADAFAEGLFVADLNIDPRPAKKAITVKKGLNVKKAPAPKVKTAALDPLEEIYAALVLGLRDYVGKNNFKKVLVGLSGGIDSSLTAVIAKDALGKENTIGIYMPSMFTSGESRAGAASLAKKIGITLHAIPINDIAVAYQRSLCGIFKGRPRNIAEENIQARIRGNILMAISNKFGYLVLTTGNKSEVSCGYCTLYGDMAGGFSVLKDVPKTLVYKLAKFVVNKKKEIIPEITIKRPPTAELKPNQKDSDTLPSYEVLDTIIEAYVEKDRPLKDILNKGLKKDLVLDVIKMVDKSEYKRRQASPGIKITPKAFGKDRRMPITNKFLEK